MSEQPDPQQPTGGTPQPYGAPAFSRYDQQQYDQQQYDQQQYADYAWRAAAPYPVSPTGPAQHGTPVAPQRNAGTGRSLLVGFGVALVAVALILGGVSLTSSRTVDGRGTALTPAFPNQPGSGGSQPGGSGSVPSGRTGTASATQQLGIVTIVSTLKYQNAQSAGTGMILSADGKVLTNNHVIRGATSIAVTVESTGRTYKATVVGTAPGSDVALIKLQGASGLRRANFAADATDVRVGDRVTGVGNAGGTGTLTAASGTVTALNRSITASDEEGQDSERLTGLIEVNARIISGDSGGPLYDSDGEIVGMNTAASASPQSDPTAYAIPIEDAAGIVTRIESGVETADIHIGYPGFLGVTTQPANGRGASVVDLLDGGPASEAGISSGSIITAIDGRSVTSPTTLRELLTQKSPGDSVRVTWTDDSGTSQSATVRLAVGPAD